MLIDRPDIEVVGFEDFLNKYGYILYHNVGYSMMPLLRQRRAIIEIRPKETDRCKKYDVVLYKRGSGYILHRILKVLPRGYIIAGDHNTFLEKDVTDDMIIGVMTRVIRDGKDITPDKFLYKIYVHLWCDAYPVRIFMLKMKRFVYRCLSFVKRRILKLIKN